MPDEPPQPDDAVRRWREAVARPEVRAELDGLHRLIADQIEARDPACWGSGRCCNFKNAGHLLYTTGLEAALALAGVEPSRHPDAASVHAAQTRGDCPFLSANLCGIHEAKPAACRIYFCDHSAQAWQNDLAERCHALVRALHERHGVPYVYAEWRGLLSRFALAPPA